MKRFVALMAVLGSLAGTTPAMASTFTLSSLNVDLRDEDPGLVMWHSNHFLGDITLNGAGDSERLRLFTLGTTEGSSDWDDILLPGIIHVGFTFTQPSPTFGGTSVGITGSALFGDSGYVRWDNPLNLHFGQGGAGLLQITLDRADFGLPGSADIFGTFHLVRDAPGGSNPVGVPEPGSLLLVGLGLAGAATHRRRRQS